MRLIDADVFEKFIEGKYKDGESTDDIKDQMLFDLSYQPTAYNVEKVVAELDVKARKSLEKYKESFELFQEEYWRGNMNGYGNAIEIVRNGGKE